MCAYDGAVTWEIVEEGEYVDVWMVGRFFFCVLHWDQTTLISGLDWESKDVWHFTAPSSNHHITGLQAHSLTHTPHNKPLPPHHIALPNRTPQLPHLQPLLPLTPIPLPNIHNIMQTLSPAHPLLITLQSLPNRNIFPAPPVLYFN